MRMIVDKETDLFILVLDLILKTLYLWYNFPWHINLAS